MTREIVSRRGVYRDLSVSPYEYQTPYGDIFKFSSRKKLDIYTRDIEKEVERVNKVLQRNELKDKLPPEIVTLIMRCCYSCFYDVVEG